MSIAMLKTMSHARRLLPNEIAEAFLPVERAADQTAIAGYAVMALALTKRDEAGLPLTVGEEALREVGEGCRHALEAQAAFRRAHALWPTIAAETKMFVPACPS
jgi:hypothetical protein